MAKIKTDREKFHKEIRESGLCVGICLGAGCQGVAEDGEECADQDSFELHPDWVVISREKYDALANAKGVDQIVKAAAEIVIEEEGYWNALEEENKKRREAEGGQ